MPKDSAATAQGSRSLVQQGLREVRRIRSDKKNGACGSVLHGVGQPFAQTPASLRPPFEMGRPETAKRTRRISRRIDHQSCVPGKVVGCAHCMRQKGASDSARLAPPDILGEAGLADPVRERIELVHGAGETMKAIVDDILDVAKMETGAIDIRPERFALTHG